MRVLDESAEGTKVIELDGNSDEEAVARLTKSVEARLEQTLGDLKFLGQSGNVVLLLYLLFCSGIYRVCRKEPWQRS